MGGTLICVGVETAGGHPHHPRADVGGQEPGRDGQITGEDRFRIGDGRYLFLRDPADEVHNALCRETGCADRGQHVSPADRVEEALVQQLASKLAVLRNRAGELEPELIGIAHRRRDRILCCGGRRREIGDARQGSGRGVGPLLNPRAEPAVAGRGLRLGGVPDRLGTKVREVRVGVAHVWNDRKLTSFPAREQRSEGGVEGDLLADLQELVLRQSEVRAQAAVGGVGEGNHGVEAVVAAAQLDDHEAATVVRRQDASARCPRGEDLGERAPGYHQARSDADQTGLEKEAAIDRVSHGVLLCPAQLTW